MLNYGRKEELTEYKIINKKLYDYAKVVKEVNEEIYNLVRDLVLLLGQSILNNEEPGPPAFVDINPSSLEIGSRGKDIYRLLDLQRIPIIDIIYAVTPLRLDTKKA